MSHTPGPWNFEATPTDTDPEFDFTDSPFWIVGGLLGEVLAVVHIQSDCEGDGNARLIAAAPELLEALKALHRNVDSDLSGFWTESTSNFMQMAEAAIAKAEGRA